jgi:hypothetical protein
MSARSPPQHHWFLIPKPPAAHCLGHLSPPGFQERYECVRMFRRTGPLADYPAIVTFIPGAQVH